MEICIFIGKKTNTLSATCLSLPYILQGDPACRVLPEDRMFQPIFSPYSPPSTISHLWQAPAQQQQQVMNSKAMNESNKPAPLSSPLTALAALELEQPPGIWAETQRDSSAPAWGDTDTLHIGNAASESTWGVQTPEINPTPLSGDQGTPVQPFCHTAPSLETVLRDVHLLLIWYERSHIHSESRQLWAFAHFKPPAVTFNKIMFNKTRSIC